MTPASRPAARRSAAEQYSKPALVELSIRLGIGRPSGAGGMSAAHEDRVVHHVDVVFATTHSQFRFEYLETAGLRKLAQIGQRMRVAARRAERHVGLLAGFDR